MAREPGASRSASAAADEMMGWREDATWRTETRRAGHVRGTGSGARAGVIVSEHTQTNGYLSGIDMRYSKGIRSEKGVP